MSCHCDVGFPPPMNEEGSSMFCALLNRCASSIEFGASLGQRRLQLSMIQAGLGKGRGEMKPMLSRFWCTGNDTIPHPTHSIFSDSPCISFDSPASVPIQLFRRSPGHTRLFPLDCETSVMHRIIVRSYCLRHRTCSIVRGHGQRSE